MPFPGYQAPSQFGYDAAVLRVGGTRRFVSRGGITFDPGIEMRDPEFDGKQSPIAGTHRITARQATITGRFKDLAPAAMMMYEPGSTSDGSSPNVITPKVGREFLSTSEYLADVECILNKSDGKTNTAVFDYMLVTQYRIITQDKDEADVELTLVGCLDPSSPLEACTYTWEIEV
jgi:hypothetical protein